MIEVPAQTPVYAKEQCPHCGVTVWHRISRLGPQSYIEADFLKEFIVDDTTKQIRRVGNGED